MRATLHTNHGAAACGGWHNLGDFQEPINLAMARDAERFQVLELIGLKVGIETPEGSYMVNLQNPLRGATTDALVSIAETSKPPLCRPVAALVRDCASAPSGAILARHVTGNPETRTVEGTEVVAFDCAFVPGEWFSACITLQGEETSATLLVWDSLGATHDGSFRAGGLNSISDNRTRRKRNLRNVWPIATKPFRGAHFAVFPPELPKRCILAGTSAKGVCPECGAPWERVLERTAMVVHSGPKAGEYGSRTTDGISGTMVTPAQSRTLGWRPTCSCYDEQYIREFQRTLKAHKRYQQDAANRWFGRARNRPGLAEWTTTAAVVLDPFAGSGTTCIVAKELGCSYIGIDSNEKYCRMARKRLGQTEASLFAKRQMQPRMNTDER